MTEQAKETAMTEQAKETAIQTVTNLDISTLGSKANFELAQRIGKMYSQSDIVPETYRGEKNIGNCVIALEIANRIGANVISVMQNLYIVHGKPGWSSTFLIAGINSSGNFTPLRYKMTGEEGTDTWGCIAWAKDKDGELLESPEVTIKIAKDEGWFSKAGSKWKNIPSLMLRYRAATFFARLYAPEKTMGFSSVDEIEDITPKIKVSPGPLEQAPKPLLPEAKRPVGRPKKEQPAIPAETVSEPDRPAEDNLNMDTPSKESLVASILELMEIVKATPRNKAFTDCKLLDTDESWQDALPAELIELEKKLKAAK